MARARRKCSLPRQMCRSFSGSTILRRESSCQNLSALLSVSSELALPAEEMPPSLLAENEWQSLSHMSWDNSHLGRLYACIAAQPPKAEPHRTTSTFRSSKDSHER